MPATQRIKPPDAKAEGKCCGVPYDTQLASINGVTVHFWIGDRDASIVKALERLMRGRRDVVNVTYSAGEPIGFWAHDDFGKPLENAS